ncbi:MAG: J domain-containing protein [Clostridia bacterium]|nr:J domain-containing protein [Clostridia bacterium]
MVFKDYYKILELDTSRVSIDEIKVAYRTVAKKYHPDVNVGDVLAEERIKDINEAYRVLSNPPAKRKYDRMWNSNVYKKNKAFSESGRKSGSFFSDFFYMFFGDVSERASETPQKALPINGENIETSIKIQLPEAFYGMNKKISLKTPNGKIKTFNVQVPEGIRDGEKIRLVGQGKQGKNGGRNGDLFLKIKIDEKSKFKIDGYDLHTELLLTPWEAALGTRTKIKSIDDEATVYIPKGIQTGEKLKIPGKGYKNGQGGRGDLVAEVKVVVPQTLTEEEKKIFEQLNKISKFNPRDSK